MKIGELAMQTNLTTSKIRYYEKQALLPQAKRTVSGYRQYNIEDINRLGVIKLAQSLGFNLAEIRLIFATNTELNHDAVLAQLENKKLEIGVLISELEERQVQIDLLKTNLNDTWKEGRCFTPEE